MTPLPDRLEIQPLSKPPAATIRVPGSKSITNRALIIGALSNPDQGCELHGALQSEDTEIMITALCELGFSVRTDWANSHIHIHRGDHSQVIPASQADLFVGNSGTSMRFLTALVSLGHGIYRLDGVSRMRERPMGDLLDALRQLGVNATSEHGNDYPPIVVHADGLKGGQVQISGEVSSQFLSGLLMVAPLAPEGIAIKVSRALVSRPYVDMTLRMIGAFGVQVHELGPDGFFVPGIQSYQARQYQVEPDASAAGYFFAAAAITGGQVSISGLADGSFQGDYSLTNVLIEMGCHSKARGGTVEQQIIRSHPALLHDPTHMKTAHMNTTIKGWPLHGVEVDMNDMSDCVMTLAAVACFADGPTTIRNVAHIRYKETDRLKALATELRKVGAEVEEFADGLKITPRPLHGAEIETYNDHRMAMSMALIGLKVPGIVIRNPGCVAKTYPRFFEDLELLRQ
jgi:3-phosphoshikimate 1-carboxyvinyltransferase